MPEMTNADLAAKIRELSAKATKVPWHAADRGCGWEVHAGEDMLCQIEGKGTGWCDSINEGFRDTMERGDAELIAVLRNNATRLAEALERNASLEADAVRYRRLQVIGCAPGGSKQLDNATVIRFSELDSFVDADLKAVPYRGDFRDKERP